MTYNGTGRSGGTARSERVQTLNKEWDNPRTQITGRKPTALSHFLRSWVIAQPDAAGSAGHLNQKIQIEGEAPRRALGSPTHEPARTATGRQQFAHARKTVAGH